MHLYTDLYHRILRTFEMKGNPKSRKASMNMRRVFLIRACLLLLPLQHCGRRMIVSDKYQHLLANLKRRLCARLSIQYLNQL